MYTKIATAFTFLSLSALCCAPADAAQPNNNETSKPGFVLSIDEGTPGADELGRGEYAAAVDVATRRNHRGQDLSAQHLLCAAYIAMEQLDNAEIACDRALSLARTMISTARNPHGHKNRPGLAKAYSNRAVLRALQGDKEAAAMDFESAMAQRRERVTIRHNMNVSETRTQYARR